VKNLLLLQKKKTPWHIHYLFCLVARAVFALYLIKEATPKLPVVIFKVFYLKASSLAEIV
jgi:hypothetical protein